jgi:hypothetical protein
MSASARAMQIAPSPISQRVARADAVVLGKVTAIAEKIEKADLYKGDERQMQIATVAVEDTLSGKKVKTVKVAFFPVMPAPAVGGGIRIIRGGDGLARLTKDQKGLFFLTKHPTKKDLYLVGPYFDVVPKTADPSFTTQRDEARKYAQVLKEAGKILESKDANLPFESAMMLVTRYRTAPAGVAKTEPVPAGQSKKLLTALAKADWKTAVGPNGMASPLNTFYLLGLQPKDGWIAPKDATQVPGEAKKWLEANAGKYKMERYVRAADVKDETEPE